MNVPKISIITVTLNDRDTIEKTIKSVLNQSYKDIEYIIIDGGSTDGALEIINRYKKNLSYFISEPDKGIYNAMNKGAKKATGDYLYFLNAGDILHNNEVLKEVVENMENTDMFFGKVMVVGENNIPNLKGTVSKNKVKLGAKVSQQAVFLKRSVFEKVGGLDEKYKIASDFDLLCKVFDSNYDVKKSDIIICDFDSSGVSSNLEKAYEDTRKVIYDRYGIFYSTIYFLFTRLKLLAAKLYFNTRNK